MLEGYSLPSLDLSGREVIFSFSDRSVVCGCPGVGEGVVVFPGAGVAVGVLEGTFVGLLWSTFFAG